ncbi:hypothetical protein AYO44_11845 [Planctomycetaceae bacterium SCGC AG-212-F19]|nr:hypothetical protein AYO44_11845 [Planctomycetaceae bacterium SCGC AG-212-F19]
MVNQLLSWWLRKSSGPPCFQIYGKSKRETTWRVIDVFATHRRNGDSAWPLWRGTCITWTSQVIAIGCDFAARVLHEQAANPASREHPLEVAGGRLSEWPRRLAAGASSQCSASEVIAHEIGHTAQCLRLSVFYLPIVGSVTLFREGPHWWNHFENDASAQGQFGGIVTGSVWEELMARLKEGDGAE